MDNLIWIFSLSIFHFLRVTKKIYYPLSIFWWSKLLSIFHFPFSVILMRERKFIFFKWIIYYLIWIWILNLKQIKYSWYQISTNIHRHMDKLGKSWKMYAKKWKIFCLFSIFHYPLSIFRRAKKLSIIHYPFSKITWIFSLSIIQFLTAKKIIHYPLSIIHFPQLIGYYLYPSDT